jgi:hypothetical protein
MEFVEKAPRRDIHAEIAAAIARAKLEHDPTALLLEVAWTILDRQERLAAQIEGTAARPVVLSDSDIQKLLTALRRQVPVGLVRVPSWNTIILAAVALAAVVLVACLAGYAAAGGFSTTCEADRGGVVCFRWTTPPNTAK